MRLSLRHYALPLAAATLMGLGPATTAHAQFGRNKVQYEKFKFEVLKSEHFDIYYYESEKAVVEQTARMAERWYTRLSKLLDHKLSGRQVIILYASHPDFEQTNAVPGEMDESTGGVTEVFKRRIVLPLAGPLAETDHVLGHELVHAFQFDITGQGRSVATGNIPGAFRLPLWFTEGMAEYLSLGPVDANTAMWMRDAAKDTLPSIRQLGNMYKYFPYRWGQAFWSYVGGRWGDDVVGRLLRRGAINGDLTRTFERTLGVHDTTLSRDWQQALNSAYDPLVAVTKQPKDYGRLLLGKDADDGGRINLAPSLSPDGKQVAFISERDLFSIEMFLADVATGKVTRKIVKTSSDPHFESLQFLYSAGAWAPDGKSFVFAGVVKGSPVLRVLRLEEGGAEREIKFPEVGEIFNPTWSPDGNRIAFSALVGGAMDLFAYNLQTDVTQRLTNDFYAELHPAWSPDGRSIAFVTDRFSSDLRRLEMGNYRLALFDVQTGAIQPVAGADEGKNINPQWSADGKNLFFVSDRTGIPNIFRVELPAGPLASAANTAVPRPEVFQVTDLYVGISGITSLSPGISVAKETGRVAFTAYDKGYHSIYVIDSAETTAGKPPRGAFPQGSPAVLPPASRSRQGVVASLADHVTGLPDAQVFSQVDYNPRISLDYVAQPYLSGGVDSWGAFVGGGASAYWSDMLGEHNLATVLQINGTLQDILGAVVYQNLSRRLNWGVAVQQIPYVIGGFAQGLIQDANGNVSVVQQLQRYRQTSRELVGLTSYPLSRVQRIELSAGLANIAFSGDVRTKTFDYFTGQELSDDKVTLEKCTAGGQAGFCLPDGLSFAQMGAALVYDNSFFGATSPILGQRYRLDFSPRLGSLNMFEASVDYRRYLMPVRPFTFAARLLHYGRYGPGGEDSRLRPLFIGYNTLIRGYDSGSFDVLAECPQSSFNPSGQLTGACPEFDRLLGSRVAIANLEMRFPLLGLLGLGSGYYGAFPIEMFFFGDAGMAWDSQNKPFFLSGGTRDPVYSMGAGWRVNLFGFAVIEMDLVKPLSRANKGWYLQFGFAPGY